MDNSVFTKTMEKARNHRDIKKMVLEKSTRKRNELKKKKKKKMN